LIPEIYHEGNKVIPLVLMADLFFGIFFSASIWYKLKDKTWYGAMIAGMGALITVVLNIILIPLMGYMGSAITLLICFLVMMVVNYFWGQYYYPIPYDLKRIAFYFGIAVMFYFISLFTARFNSLTTFTLNSLLFAFFCIIVILLEKSELMQILKKNKR